MDHQFGTRGLKARFNKKTIKEYYSPQFIQGFINNSTQIFMAYFSLNAQRWYRVYQYDG